MRGSGLPAGRDSAGIAAAVAVALLAAGAGPARARASGVAPAGEGPERVYAITMNATYDPVERTIAGTQHLRWRNTSSVPVTELQFHLYLNAFAGTQTTFFRESGGQLRGVRIPAEKWGWVEVTGMRTSAGDDLKAGEQFLQPDDGNTDDRTVARYPLPAPLPPGEAVELDIEFNGRMPGVFARNGAHGDFVLGGQWFPKVAVFEDAGVRGRAEAGWNCHQYHANSEFYADFGDYDVSITLPLRYRGHIGGTGRLVEETATADTVTARFVQEGVNDFAWTGDPAFVVVRDRFDPLTDVSAAEQGRIAGLLGLTPEEIALLPVDITLLVRPENRSQAARYISSLKVALAGYGLRLGAYPYPHFTLVDPPRGAMGSGGMEYVTFITLGTHPLLGRWPFDEVRARGDGHHPRVRPQLLDGDDRLQRVRGVVARRGDQLVLRHDRHRRGLRRPGRGPRTRGHRLRQQPRDPRSGTLHRPGRPGVVAVPDRAARTASTRIRALPSPSVISRTWSARRRSTRRCAPSSSNGSSATRRPPISSEASRPASGATCRGSSSRRSTRPAPSTTGCAASTSSRIRQTRGVVWRDGVRTLEGEEKGDDEDGKDEDYRTVVVVERLGEFVHPVTVELRSTDDHVERREWDGQERWVRWEVVRGARLVAAEVDPDDLMALDVNRLNNGRLLEERSAPANKLLVHLLFWLQNLLAATAFVG